MMPGTRIGLTNNFHAENSAEGRRLSELDAYSSLYRALFVGEVSNLTYSMLDPSGW
jgi:hypothetical protein